MSDFEACPGRERVVREDAKVSAPSECPGKGRSGRHSVKGGGRGGKDDKSSDSAECPGKERDVGREVGFETCIEGLDVVETELDVVTRTELDMAFDELDSLEKYKALQGSSFFLQKKYFTYG